MAVFIFVGDLTEEDIEHLARDGGAEKNYDLAAELGVSAEVLKHLTAEDIEDLRKKERGKPPVFIDRNKIRWTLVDDVDHDGIHTRICAEKEQVEALPVFAGVRADIKPIVYADWKLTDELPRRPYCSACYRQLVPNLEWIRIYDIPTKFCPSCGATMRKELRK